MPIVHFITCISINMCIFDYFLHSRISRSSYSVNTHSFSTKSYYTVLFIYEYNTRWGVSFPLHYSLKNRHTLYGRFPITYCKVIFSLCPETRESFLLWALWPGDSRKPHARDVNESLFFLLSSGHLCAHMTREGAGGRAQRRGAYPILPAAWGTLANLTGRKTANSEWVSELRAVCGGVVRARMILHTCQTFYLLLSP